MASSLEANWALTFDTYDLGWVYEPFELRLDDGQIYWPDLWFPGQRVWCEVKGPHDLRLDKTYKLWKQVSDPGNWRASMVVVARETGRLHRPDNENAEILIEECPHCRNATFIDPAGAWQCRRCGRWFKPSGTPIRFVRLPRRGQ